MKKAPADYSTWLTKAEAAQACGVSTKQIERWTQDKRLQAARWKRPEGGPAISVYHPGDVERIARERNPEAEAFDMPAHDEKPAPASTTALAVRQPGAQQFMESLAAALANSATQSQTSKTAAGVRLAERLYLTIGEAAEFTGLGVGYLRRQIAAGKLKLLKGAGPHGADLVKRADLVKL
jgi:predicted DNA-binding transcriptional regulator YafY